MTNLPGLEPAALEAAALEFERHHRNACYPEAMDVESDIAAKAIVSAYLAARSAPEAGKAVVKPLEWSSEPPYSVARPFAGLHYATEVIWPENGKAFDYVMLSGPTIGAKRFASLSDAKAAAQADYEQCILSALASVPAPSGAEPVAQLGGAPDDLHNLMKVVFADMTVERLNEVCKEVLARRNPALTRLEDRLTTSEAEATSLRRKLEEAERQRDDWKATHGRVIQGFAEVCEAVGVQFDAPDAVAYAINAKISNAEHDLRAAERKLEEYRRALKDAGAYIERCYVTDRGATILEQIVRTLSGASE